MTTSRSMAGAARTSATSSTSSATGPRPTVIKLEQNYRSTQLILDAAHAVVSKNVARTDKKLWTKNDRGRLIERFEAYNEEEEAEWIVRRVEELTGTRGSTLTRRADDGASVKLRDIAILYRTNAQSRAIEEACLRYGIRYQVVGGTRFYSRREVKDALAYLRILRSDADGVSFERVINVPARAIGDKTIGVVRALRRRARASRTGSGWSGPRRVRSRSSPGGRAPRSPSSWASSGGCGRASASCRCRSSWTTSWSGPATGRCSRTAPRRARSAGRTCSSCVRSRRATTTSPPRMPSTGCSRRPRWWPIRTATSRTRTCCR